MKTINNIYEDYKDIFKDKGDVYKSLKSPHQILKYLLRLAEAKLHLVWRFETGEEITSLCVANYIKNWEFNKQILIGSKDSYVYSLSIDKKLLWKFRAQDEILSICATDFTNEGSEEIIVASKDRHIYILDAEGQLMWKYKCQTPLKAVTLHILSVILQATSKAYRMNWSNKPMRPFPC